MSDDALTVAEAAAQLGTTIPRLRRLLSRPEMVGVSQLRNVETKRGTRTSLVVLVSEMKTLEAALEKESPAVVIQERSGNTFSNNEILALRGTLQRTEELLDSQRRELAGKDEIIQLLREKLENIERKQIEEQKQEQAVPVPETLKGKWWERWRKK